MREQEKVIIKHRDDTRVLPIRGTADISTLLSNLEEHMMLRQGLELTLDGLDCSLGDMVVPDKVYHGQVPIQIIDKMCDLEHRVYVSETCLISTLRNNYMEQFNGRRFNHPLARLYLDDQPLDDEGATLYQAFKAIRGEVDGEERYENARLRHVTPKFNVRISENAELGQDAMWHEVEVQDHFTISMVKDAFYDLAEEGLSENDLLVFKSLALDNNTQLYKHCIGDGAELTVQKEDVLEISHKYRCGEAQCGHIETLRSKHDAVSCRECGNLVLFKLRTREHCQYVAR